MKKMLFAAAVAVSFTFASCGGGWNEENKKSLKDTCTMLEKMSYDKADAGKICDCYIENLVKKYPDGDFTPEQNTAEMDACSKGYKTESEKSMEATMQEMNSMPEEGAEGAEGTMEAAGEVVEEKKEAAKH
ncbi:MAG: hypothetical protein ACKVOR_02515 [Flavobacteriales bacterium]